MRNTYDKYNILNYWELPLVDLVVALCYLGHFKKLRIIIIIIIIIIHSTYELVLSRSRELNGKHTCYNSVQSHTAKKKQFTSWGMLTWKSTRDFSSSYLLRSPSPERSPRRSCRPMPVKTRMLRFAICCRTISVKYIHKNLTLWILSKLLHYLLISLCPALLRVDN